MQCARVSFWEAPEEVVVACRVGLRTVLGVQLGMGEQQPWQPVSSDVRPEAGRVARWYLEQGVEELEGRVVADAAENGAKREQGRRRGGAREPSISTSLPVITKLCSPSLDE